jgi:HPt (histidine-containing phosphotransfer) domain-containing protein
VQAYVSFVTPAASAGSVADLSLEDLMNIKDTPASRKEQQLDEAINRNAEHQPEEAAAAPAAVSDTFADGLDRGVLDDIRALDPSGGSALLHRVIGIYLKSAPDLVRAMRRAADAGDAVAVGTAVHSLKSSSLNVGAARLGKLCREIEAAAKSTPPALSAALVAALETEYLRVELLLRSELENRDA